MGILSSSASVFKIPRMATKLKGKQSPLGLFSIMNHQSFPESPGNPIHRTGTEVPLTPVVPVKAKFKNGRDEQESISRWTHQLSSVAGRGESSLVIKDTKIKEPAIQKLGVV